MLSDSSPSPPPAPSDDSPASPTLLGGKPHEVTQLNPADEEETEVKEEKEEERDKEREEEGVDGGTTAAASTKRRVCFEQTVVYVAADDEATQPYASEDTAATDEGKTTGRGEEEEEEREGTLDRDKGEELTAEDEGDTLEVEPTVAYHLEESTEDSVAEKSTGGGPTPTVPYFTGDSIEDMTVEESHVRSPRAPGTSDATAEMPTVDIGSGETSEAPTGARQTRVAAQVEPTVPYLLESSEEEDQENKGLTNEQVATPAVSGKMGKSHPEVKSDKSLDASNERLPSAGQGDRLHGEEEGESSGSDLSDTIPALVDAGKHSKQKTLFARKRGRGRGGRGRGRGRSSTSSGRKDSEASGEKQRGKGRRGGKGKPESVMSKSEVEPTSSAAAVGVTVGDAEDHKGKQRVGRRRSTRSHVPSKVVSDGEATAGGKHATAARDRDVTDSTAEPATSRTKPPADSSIVDPLSEESPDVTVHMTHGHSSVASSTSTPAKMDPVASKSDDHSSVASSTSTPVKVDPVVSKSDDHSSVASSTSTPVKVDSVASKSDDDHSSVASSTSTPVKLDPVTSIASSSRVSSGSRGGRGRGRGKRPSTPRKGKAAKPAIKSEGSVCVQSSAVLDTLRLGVVCV